MCFFKHSLGAEKIKTRGLQKVLSITLRWNRTEERSEEGPRSVVSSLSGTGNKLICPHLKGFLMGIISSWAEPLLQLASSERGSRLCSYSWNHFVGPFSPCFFHIHINHTYMCLYSVTHAYIIYVFICKYTSKPHEKHLHCHSERHRGRICRKTLRQGHRCPWLMNMQFWHLKLFSRFHSAFLHWHQFPSNHKGFQINTVGSKLPPILPELISVHISDRSEDWST